jgi:hypothetical protein
MHTEPLRSVAGCVPVAHTPQHCGLPCCLSPTLCPVQPANLGTHTPHVHLSAKHMATYSRPVVRETSNRDTALPAAAVVSRACKRAVLSTKTCSCSALLQVRSGMADQKTRPVSSLGVGQAAANYAVICTGLCASRWHSARVQRCFNPLRASSHHAGTYNYKLYRSTQATSEQP